MAYVWRSETTFGNGFSPSTVGSMGQNQVVLHGKSADPSPRFCPLLLLLFLALSFVLMICLHSGHALAVEERGALVTRLQE